MNKPANDSDKLKILIAEDNEELLALYDKALPDIVFDKSMVSDGEKALEVYKTWHPDIVVLDILMPIKTGYSALKDIRETVRNGRTTIIISTSIDDIDEVKACKILGIQGYIVKPFDYHRIAREILEFYREKEPEKAAKALSSLESSSHPH